MPLKPFALAPGQTPQTDSHPPPGSFRSRVKVSSTSHNPYLPPRSQNDEAAQKRTSRRAEIERRCQELDPPISPSTLINMEAFNAAIQISMPLNESSWDLLKAHLLVQRPEAERKNGNSQFEVRPSGQGVAGVQQLEAPGKANADSTLIWTEIEKPLREKLKDFAEQHIASRWASGMSVNKGSSGSFAADVLQYVKTRYLDLTAREDKLLIARSMTIPPNSPLHDSRRLKLEDMRWIFDDMVKPHTERFGKDIFLCSICEATTHKKFSFDAVIQHYAAKHTASLSHGNAVVYWKADWPLEPPFHPAPDTLWHREADYRFASASQYAPSPAWTPLTQSSWMSPMPPGQPNGIYNVQCEEVISSARHAWDILYEFPSLPDNVRLFVIIHRVFAGFASKGFTNKPTLSMFTDCVLHKPALKPLRDMRVFHCKVCRANVPPGFTVASNEFDLADLLSHFQKMHVEIGATSPQGTYGRAPATPGGDAARQDWQTDMVQLPDDAFIRALARVPGMTTAALELMAASFPSLFPPSFSYVEAQELMNMPFAQPLQNTDHHRQGAGMPPPPEPHRATHQYARARSPPMQYTNPDDPRRMTAAALREKQQYVEGATFTPDPFPREIIYVEASTGPRRAECFVPMPALPTPNRGRIGYRESTSDLRYRDLYANFDTPDARAPSHRSARSMPVDYMDTTPITPDHAGDIGHPFDRPIRPLSPERLSSTRNTPEPEGGATAAENFLNNFDVYASEAIGEGRASDRPTSIRNYSTGVTPLRVRPSNERLRSHESTSRRHTPRTHESPRRHISGDTSPVSRYDAPGRTPLRESTALEDAVAIDRDQVSPKHGQRGNTHYENQQQTRRDPVYRDLREFAYEAGTLSSREPIEIREDPSRRMPYRSPPLPHHHYRQRAPTKPIRYIEILPDGRQRLVEELPSPMYEPIEYVRTSSSDQQDLRHVNSYGSAPPLGSDEDLYYMDRPRGPKSSTPYDQDQYYVPYDAPGPSSQPLPSQPRHLRYETEPGNDPDSAI